MQMYHLNIRKTLLESPCQVRSFPILDLRPEKNDGLFVTKLVLRSLILIFWGFGSMWPHRTKESVWGSMGQMDHSDTVEPRRSLWQDRSP